MLVLDPLVTINTRKPDDAPDKDNETGRVTAVWPGSALHFQAMMGKPRWEDYEIKYQNVSHHRREPVLVLTTSPRSKTPGTSSAAVSQSPKRKAVT